MYWNLPAVYRAILRCMPVIKVSDAAYAELQKRAAAEGRTMVMIVDRLLLGGDVSAAPAVEPRVRRPPQAAAQVPPAVQPGRCPSCGCSRVMHDAKTWRCDKHRQCVWKGEDDGDTEEG